MPKHLNPYLSPTLRDYRWCIFFVSLFFANSEAQITANFTYLTPGDSCESRAVQFNASSSTGAITTFEWNFSNLTTGINLGTGTGINISKNFDTTGLYQVRLTVRDAAANTATKTVQIRVYKSPIVNFSSTTREGCLPLSVPFKDISTAGDGTIKKWEWSYNDGKSEEFTTATNPTHVYSAAGVYTPTLIVTNSVGCVASLPQNQYIKVYPKITPSFLVTDNFSCTSPKTVTFENTSSVLDGTFNFIWDFGDGVRLANNGILQTHTYTKPGIYHIKLIAKNPPGNCADSIIGSGTKDVIIGKPAADFTLQKDTVCQAADMTFTAKADTTQISNQSRWFFEDNGAQPYGTSTSHAFTRVGRWKVKYFTFNTYSGCYSDTLVKEVEVLPIPTADFTVNTPLGCQIPHRVTFTNISTDANAYQWNFGDGSLVPQMGIGDISHAYTNFGTYTVSLRATNAANCSNLKTYNYIRNVKPTIDFTYTPNEGCPPLAVDIKATATSNDPIAKYIYNFGNGRIDTLTSPTHTGIYPQSGNFSIKVSILTAQGCSAESTPKPVIVSDICDDDGDGGGGGGGGGGGFDASGGGGSGCDQKYTFTFSDTVANTRVISWNFDGVPGGNANPTTHTFPNDGIKKKFIVTAVIRDLLNATDLTYKKRMVVVDEKARFLPDKISICRNGTINFKTLGIDSTHIHKFIWDYDDTTKIDTIDNVAYFKQYVKYHNGDRKHIYADTGVFHPKLAIVDKFGCVDSLRFDSIVVRGPRAKFGTETSSFCKGQFAVAFSDSSKDNGINPIKSWKWEYGDNSSAIFNKDTLTSHKYVDPTRLKTFTAILTVTDDIGCSDTSMRVIRHPLEEKGPKAKFTLDTNKFCGNKFDLVLTDSTMANGRIPIIQWLWNFGDNTTLTSTEDTAVTHPYNNTSSYKNYLVSLTVTDSVGCTDTYETHVESYAPKASFYTYDTLRCGKFNITFYNSSDAMISNYNQYTWRYGNGQTTTGFYGNYTYADTGKFSITLVVKDNGGCVDSMSKSKYVKLVKPKASFSVGSDTSKCVTKFTLPFVSTSTYANSYVWDFGDGESSSTNQVEVNHFYKEADTYPVRLIVTGLDGCKDTTIQNVRIKGPKGELLIKDHYICLGEPLTSVVHGKNISRYFWDFKDLSSNTGINLLDSVEHIYKQTGKYLPNIILLSPEGCQITLLSTDTVMVDQLNAGPDANIECGDIYTALQGRTALNIPGNYVWEGPLGAGYVPDKLSLNTQVNTPGNYILKTKNNGCDMTDTAVVTTSGIVPTAYAGADNKLDCIAGTTMLNGATTTADTKFKWKGPNGALFTPHDSVAQPSVDKVGSYVLTVIQKFCTTTDTVLVSECTLRPTDTTLTICANVPNAPATYKGYNLTQLNNKVIGTVNSSVVWYTDRLFSAPVASPGVADLVNGNSFFAQIVSMDGTEVGRAEVKLIVHDYVKVSFDDIPNTCTLSDTIQITGILPVGGSFTGLHFLSDGRFVPPSDSGTYAVKYKYTSPQGCPDSLSKVATVIEVPTAPLVTDTLSYCQRTTPIPGLSATAKPNHTLYWYVDTLQAPLLAAPTLDRKVGLSTYYVSQINSLCESPKSTMVVVVDSVPTALAISPLTEICEGFSRTVRLHGLPQSHYMWQLKSDDQALVIHPSNADTLQFEVGSTNVVGKVVETTLQGCVGDTSYFTVPVTPLPDVNAGADKKLDCISGQTILLGSSATANTTFKWRGPLNTTFTSSDSMAQPSVNLIGSYVLTATFKTCEKTDTVLVTECTLRPKDTTVALCANIAGIPATYQGYDLQQLNTYVVGGVSSTVAWYSDSLFLNTLLSPTSLVDSVPYYAQITSMDGTEVARAQVTNIIHDFVKVNFDDIPNTCTLADSIQITGAFPLGGVFSGPYVTSSGNFVPPSDSGKYSIQYKYTSPQGCPDSLSKIATVIEVPTPPIVSDTLEYCQRLLPLPQLTAVAKPSHTLFWYSDTLKLHSLVAPTLGRSVDTVSYFVSQKNSLCESPKAKILVVIDSVPQAPTVSPLSPICQGFERTLKTTGLLGSTYNWLLSGGSDLQIDASTLDTLHLTAGTIHMAGKVVETTLQGCIGDTGYFNIQVDSLPTEALVNGLPADTNHYCITHKIKTLNANTPQIGIGHWEILKNTDLASFDPTKDTTLLLDFTDLKDTLVANWVIINGVCPPSNATLKVFPVQAFTPEVSLKKVPTVCEGTPVSFEAIPGTASGSQPKFSFYDSHHHLLSGTDSTSPFVLTATQDSAVYVVLHSNYPCLNVDTATSQRVDVEVISKPTAQIDFNHDTICVDQGPILLHALRSPFDGITYEWHYESKLKSQSKDPEMVTITKTDSSGKYLLKVYNTYCPPDYDSISVKIYEKPVLDLATEIQVMYQAGKVLEIPLGIGIFQKPQDLKAIYWSPTDYLGYNKQGILYNFFNDTLLQKPLYLAQEQELETSYNVTVTTGPKGKGCETTASTLIKNYIPISLPNAFSPNGDGLNDTWIIRGLAKYPHTKVKVFNRWGNPLFEDQQGYKTPWDGASNGSKIPFGTYYYVIDFLGSEDHTDYATSGWLVVVE